MFSESAREVMLLMTTNPDPAPQKKPKKRTQNRTSWTGQQGDGKEGDSTGWVGDTPTRLLDGRKT